MPSKAYIKFQNNLQTVQRLNETYEQMKKIRSSRGRGAFDHITRSSIVFLVSAFEVYCEDILCEAVQCSINAAKDAVKLPHSVKKNINTFVRNENNHVPPMNLCDEGWRQIYIDIVRLQADHLNSPKIKNLKELFEKYLGILPTNVDKISNIDQLDSIIEFRGEIVHQVKSTTYVHIEDVQKHLNAINEIVIGIDLLIREHIKSIYNVKAPWNDTYVHIA